MGWGREVGVAQPRSPHQADDRPWLEPPLLPPQTRFRLVVWVECCSPSSFSLLRPRSSFSLLRPRSSRAPAVARASSWVRLTPARRTRSSMLDHGDPASIRAAVSVLMPRIDESPSRRAVRSTGTGPVGSRPSRTSSSIGSSEAFARPASTCGRRTTTPWRLASATRLWGDQNPMGWALSSPAVKAAG